MSAKDYLDAKDTFEDSYPNISLFLSQKKLLEEKKKRKISEVIKNKKTSLNKNAKNKEDDIENTFKSMNKYSSSVMKNSDDILNNFKLIAGILTTVGITFLSINKILNNINTSNIENVYGGGGDYTNTGYGKTHSASALDNVHMSEEGKKRLKADEGCVLYAYDDKGPMKNYKHVPFMPGDKLVGTLTIGYGHTAGVKPGMKITQAEADRLFETDIIVYENKVKSALKRKGIKTNISQNQFDAMVNYTYNAGSLGNKFLTKLKGGDYLGAASELEVGGQNAQRMTRIQQTFKQDVTSDNKLKGDVKPLSTTTIYSKNVKIEQLSGVKSTGKGLSYDENKTDITSQTLLSSGTNKHYDKNKGSLGTFMGKTITSGIGKRNVKGGSAFHRGLDLDYKTGEPVYSFTDGVITCAEVITGFGRLVIVTDNNKYQHLYGHLSKITVSKGKKIKKGSLIGYAGGSTTISGRLVDNHFPPHLHYGIWKPGGTRDKYDYIDPRTYEYPQDEGKYDSNSVNTKKLEVNNNELKNKQKEQIKKQQNLNQSNKSNKSGIIINKQANTNVPKTVNINKVKNNSHANKKE